MAFDAVRAAFMGYREELKSRGKVSWLWRATKSMEKGHLVVQRDGGLKSLFLNLSRECNAYKKLKPIAGRGPKLYAWVLR